MSLRCLIWCVAEVVQEWVAVWKENCCPPCHTLIHHFASPSKKRHPSRIVWSRVGWYLSKSRGHVPVDLDIVDGGHEHIIPTHVRTLRTVWQFWAYTCTYNSYGLSVLWARYYNIVHTIYGQKRCDVTDVTQEGQVEVEIEITPWISFSICIDIFSRLDSWYTCQRSVRTHVWVTWKRQRANHWPITSKWWHEFTWFTPFHLHRFAGAWWASLSIQIHNSQFPGLWWQEVLRFVTKVSWVVSCDSQTSKNKSLKKRLHKVGNVIFLLALARCRVT